MYMYICTEYKNLLLETAAKRGTKFLLAKYAEYERLRHLNCKSGRSGPETLKSCFICRGINFLLEIPDSAKTLSK